MGYNITIGNVVPFYPDEGEYSDNEPRFVVEDMTDQEAPVFPGDSMTGKSNSRSPSYTQWAEFCKRTDLYRLFFDKEEGLMRYHPGTILLRKKHLEVVDWALQLHKRQYPDIPVGCCMCVTCQSYFGSEGLQHTDGYLEPHSYDRVRLEWLAFWMRWALTNCARAGIYNT
jgi:hypothetical protein